MCTCIEHDEISLIAEFCRAIVTLSTLTYDLLFFLNGKLTFLNFFMNCNYKSYDKAKEKECLYQRVGRHFGQFL